MKWKKIILGTLLSCVACGDPHESAREEQLDFVEELVEILSDIRDKDDAIAAKDELIDLSERIKEAQAEQAELEKPTPEQREAIEEKFSERQKGLEGRLQKEMMRIFRDQSIRAELDAVMKDFR